MTCDCIPTINAQLPEDKGRIELVTMSNPRTGATRKALVVYATRYTRGGTPKRGAFVEALFCPFCGERTFRPMPSGYWDGHGKYQEPDLTAES